MAQSPTLRVVIVDDEEHCIKTLAWELKSCPLPCEVIATFTNSVEAAAEIPKLEPDVLFLDIEMPRLNGFELLAELDDLRDLKTHLIFCTAYSEYAVKAFKYSAIDYLLKPIDGEELEKALRKVEDQRSESTDYDASALKHLFNQLQQGGQSRQARLSLPTSQGWELVEIDNIVRCQSDGSYTSVYLTDGTHLTISRNLKQIEDSLPAELFYRVHNSHLVNLDHVRRYLRVDGGSLVMDDGSEVAVARSRKDKVLSLLK